jgi:DNA repair protein RecN (Recombination protein N)
MEAEIGSRMLRSLRVRNLALAENVAVTFEPGLNVITGETGAGKSMLVGALSLLLGERADKTLIRTGEDAASAEAVFEMRDRRDVDGALEGLGLPPCEDGQLVLRRVVRAAGGQNLVNDAPVTLQALKQLGERLVDLHGPHDHQSLFHPEAQLAILDAFGRLGKERAAYGDAFARRRDVAARKAEIEAAGGDVASQIDLLAYRVKEIEQAQVAEGEEETIRREHDLAGHAQRVLELTGGVVAALTDGEAPAFAVLAAVQRPLDELERLLPEAAEWRTEAAALASRTQELAASVRRAVERVEADPTRLEWLDQRLSTYQRLKKKYGGSVPAILATLEESRRRLADLQTRGERLAQLDAEWRALDSEVRRLGAALGRQRRTAAGRLAEAITGELEFLGFPSSAFAIDLAAIEPQADGMDGIEFGFAPNPGEAMRPLRLIASSGEISRVMLATKAVLAQHDRIPVLVFDEIDANLGGEMGDAVGLELAGVAERHQVLCITHLPQVAVHGTTHLAVSKSIRDGRTFSEVARVDGDDRVAEIERMLGGRAASDATRRHAREMLQRARRAKR